MSSFLQTLSKDKPLYSLTVGEFETLMAELMPKTVPSDQIIPNSVTDDEKLSIEDCASYLKVSKTTIWRYKKNGVIPFYKAGNTVYFKRPEVDEALSSKPKKKGVGK